MNKSQNKKGIRFNRLHSRIAMLSEPDSKMLLTKSLKDSLTLYILANSKVPVSALLKELAAIESEVGSIISSIVMSKKLKTQIPKNLTGFLRGTVSVILMNAFVNSAATQLDSNDRKL